MKNSKLLPAIGLYADWWYNQMKPDKIHSFVAVRREDLVRKLKHPQGALSLRQQYMLSVLDGTDEAFERRIVVTTGKSFHYWTGKRCKFGEYELIPNKTIVCVSDFFSLISPFFIDEETFAKEWVIVYFNSTNWKKEPVWSPYHRFLEDTKRYLEAKIS